MNNIVLTDRYKATGTPYPNEDSCDECEGMGAYPVEVSKLNTEAVSSPRGNLLVIGQKDADGNPMPEDDWIFVQCPHCEGSKVKKL